MSGELSHSPAEVIAQLIQTWDDAQVALGNPSVGPIYFSNEPSELDDVVTIYDSPTGQSDGRAMIDGELWEHWGIQARIRASEHKEGFLRAKRIRKFWSEGVYQAVVTMTDPAPDGSQYVVWAITKIGQILALGKQTPQTKRSIFTINATSPIRELIAPSG